MPTAFELAGLPLSAGSMGFLLFCIAGIAIIAALARKEMRADLDRRAVLLDAESTLFGNPKVTTGSDGYPILEGTCGGNVIRLEVVPDSLVPRRLPQLWPPRRRSRPAPSSRASARSPASRKRAWWAWG